MGVQGEALVLPPGSAKRIKLEGDQLKVTILGYGSWEAWIEYPDGYRRHHQVSDIHTLLQKVTGQLKTRYNIDSFQFLTIPNDFSTGATITIGEIKYA